MIDSVDNYVIEFNRSVLNALKTSISDIYKKLISSGLSAIDAESILKTKIDRMAFTELCPQVFTAITEQYEMMKKPDAAMIKNGIRYDQFSWDIQDTEALDILRKNNVFLASKYYNRLEAGNVRERIEKAFTEGKSPSSIANALRFEFGDMNKTLRSYNEMYINTVSHTARNFANINTYQQIGLEYSRIVGFRDELTCPQCSRLIGRIVSVKTQAKAMQDYLSVDFEQLGYDKAMDQIKTVNPWLTEKQLIKAGFEKPSYSNDAENIKHTAKIIQPGLELPIFHGSCRCSTEAVFEIDGKNSLVLGGGGGKLQEGGNNIDAINAIRSGNIKQHEAVNKLDLSPAEKIRAHEELLLKNNQNKYETVVLVDDNGVSLLVKDGSKSSVEFEIPTGTKTVLHNHPTSNALSKEDIMTALRNQITVKALAPNNYYGNIEYAITPKKPLRQKKIKEIADFNLNYYSWYMRKYYVDNHDRIEHKQRCSHLAMLKTAERYKNEVEYVYTTRNK